MCIYIHAITCRYTYIHIFFSFKIPIMHLEVVKNWKYLSRCTNAYHRVQSFSTGMNGLSGSAVWFSSLCFIFQTSSTKVAVGWTKDKEIFLEKTYQRKTTAMSWDQKQVEGLVCTVHCHELKDCCVPGAGDEGWVRRIIFSRFSWASWGIIIFNKNISTVATCCSPGMS